MKKELNDAGKEQVAMALILLKDWKTGGRWDAGMVGVVIELAETLGVRPQFEKLLSTVPVMRVEPRYPTEASEASKPEPVWPEDDAEGYSNP